MRQFLIILALIGSIWRTSPARDLILSGSVVDSVSNLGIPNVAILVEGTTNGTVTDRNGYFALPVAENQRQSDLLIQHIAYRPVRLAIPDFRDNMVIRLAVKNILLPEMQVEADRKPYKYDQELTNIISEIPAIKFENKGFVDAADVLLSDQSVLVDETLSGRKTVSVRGSNNDEVIVLFDGIRINNNFNNQFDLAMIDPGTLQQIDVIKGGSSATVGAYGSAAVINFIPKLEQDYLIKFQQRFGSYDSGDWGLNLYKNLAGLKVFSAVRQGASNQKYADQPAELAITHFSSTYLLNIQRPFGRNSGGDIKHLLRVRLLGSKRDYNNRRYFENLTTDNLIDNLTYTACLAPAWRTNLSLTRQKTAESQRSRSYISKSEIKRTTADRSYQIAIDQSVRHKNFNLFFGYNWNISDLTARELYYRSDASVYWDIPAYFKRQNDYFSASFQFHNTEHGDLLAWNEVNFNLTLQQAHDRLRPVSYNWLDTVSIHQEWSEAAYQLALTFTEKATEPHLLATLSYGLSYNIPTPYQQIAYLRYKPFSAERILLRPEYKKNLEADLTYSGDTPDNKFTYEIGLAIFNNLYIDKFREVRISNSPLIVFDNFSESEIYGLEVNGQAGLCQQMLDLHASLARYFPSDKIAFPFKSDRKITAGLTFDYHGFNLDLTWFSESARIGWIKQRNGETYLTELPAYANLDLHLTKTLKLRHCQGSVAFSARNLIDRELALDGITIYDRRFYLNFGIEL